MPVIGVLSGGSAVAGTFRVAAIQQGLKEAGYVEGQNVAIEYRWAEYQFNQLPALAADLAARPGDGYRTANILADFCWPIRYFALRWPMAGFRCSFLN